MRTQRHTHRLVQALVAILVCGLFSLVLAPAAGAKPDKEAPGPDPEGTVTYQPAAASLNWSLVPRAQQWVDAWKPWDHTASGKPWQHQTYDPRYVHPTSFAADFANQCVDEIDFNLEMNDGDKTVNTYNWFIDGAMKSSMRACYETRLDLMGQSLHEIRLEVRDPSGDLVRMKTGLARAKDHVVVLFGDSAASGEGSPEGERIKNDSAVWGTWVDRRCHRSTHAATPRAVMDLEAADPHSTVTFLNFACSGATVEKANFKGSGILGPYWGIEGPKGLETESSEDVITGLPWLFIPSQLDQLSHALGVTTRNGAQGLAPSRSIDRFVMSGGINDVRFADLAMACVIKTDCENEVGLYSPSNPLKTMFDSNAAQIPASYAKVRQGLDARNVEIDEGFVMEYPNPLTQNKQGKLCTSILGDVLPASSVHWILFLLSTPIGLPFLPLIITLLSSPAMSDYWPIIGNALVGTLHWDADEIAWLDSTAMPRLTKAVKDGAASAGFTYIDGMADLFIGHGYCATDNWLVRAPQSSYRQGPWDFVSRPVGLAPFGLGIHIGTQGLIHPNPTGYKALSTKVAPKLLELVNKAPVAVPDHYETTKGVAYDTGFGAGVLLNDIDADGDELYAQLVDKPTKGTVTLSSNGRLRYTPDAGTVGKDVMTYRVSDGSKWSAPAQVSVSITDPELADWQWTVSTVDNIPVVAPGTKLDLPLCERCTEAAGKIPVITIPPRLGTVELQRDLAEGYRVIYTAASPFTGDGKLLDGFEVEMRAITDGRLGDVLGSIRIEVYVDPDVAR